MFRLRVPDSGPVLDTAAPSFTVTFATWHSGDAQSFWAACQWSGQASGVHRPPSPLFTDIQVGIALLRLALQGYISQN